MTPPLGTGVAASPEHLTFTANPVTVSFGNQAVIPLFAGLTPCFAGLYQINVRIPSGTQGGDIAIEVIIAGVSSPPVLVAIKYAERSSCAIKRITVKSATRDGL